MTKAIVRLRLQAVAKQNGLCFYCRCPLYEQRKIDSATFASRHALSPRQARRFASTAEHLVPKSEGGTNRAENIVAACRHCNSKRHQRRNAPSFKDYRDHVLRRLGNGKWHPRWAHDAMPSIGAIAPCDPALSR
jgi:5-methylcytosine-specific restriction endonuclease McrA